MAKKKRVPGPSQHDIESEGLPSASGFDAEFRCPGKRALCKKLPSEADTAIQRRGIRIHTAMETWDLEQLAETDRRTAQRIMYCESQLVHEYDFEGSETTFEERVWDTDELLNHTWSGRVDRYDWKPNDRRLMVIDDKTGWLSPAPIDKNWQIRSEGALLAEILDAREIVMALIHPHHPDRPWEAKVFTRYEADCLLDTVRNNVKQIQEPDQPRIPGGLQCHFCKAKRICPEYKANAKQLAKTIRDEISSEGFDAILRRSKKERGEHVMWIKQVMKDFEFELEQYVELVIREGMDAIDGWTLKRQLRRQITDEVKAMELTEQAFGTETMQAAMEFNLGKLEKHLAKSKGSREAKDLVKKALQPVIQFKKTKYFLDESKSL